MHKLRAWVPPNLLTLLHDSAMAGLSFLLALYLRLGERTWAFTQDYALHGAASFALLMLVLHLYSRIYRRVWRYTSLNDLLALARLGTVALVVYYAGLWLVQEWQNLPRSVPAIHWMCLMLTLCSGRVLWRLLHDRSLLNRLVHGGTARVPVLLIGATLQAEMFLREAERSGDFPYRAVGLVDDRPQTQGREIHHVRIYGALAELDYILHKLARKGRMPQRLLLTEPSLNRESLDAILAVAESHNLTLARLPSLMELQAGERVQSVRPVAMEDILGRPQVALDRAAMAQLVQGKRVIVTGAGGSIGSELVRQMLAYRPEELLLFEQSEYSLYKIDREVAGLAPELPRHAVIGDVRQAAQLDRVFAAFKPQLVVHAAAIKHVPLAEANPEQAVLTNILGGKRVADACLAHGVQAMVQISTDKAVNPTSVMGASKRVAEMYGQSLAQKGGSTRFITVRFGNVLNSAGSVVPLFQQQIEAGGPLTVTHKDMVRYFMTITEAVQLVLQAAALGMQESEHAPIFVLDMGEPMKIEALACQMIRLSGQRPYKDIPIHFTGLRPGEKLYEELFADGEHRQPTSHPSIHRAQARAVLGHNIAPGLDALIAAAEQGAKETLRPLLKRLVPEYLLPVEEAA